MRANIQHVLVFHLRFESVYKISLLKVCSDFLANTGENLENKRDHKVENYQHGANPKQDEEKPRPVVAHHCAVHVGRHVPVVDDHHMEQSDQAWREVVEIE